MLARFAPVTIGLALAAGAGCADVPPATTLPNPTDDTTGIGELAAPLTELATPCTFASVSGVMTMTVTIDDDEIGVISKRAVDSAMLVNGAACGTATSTTVKRIVVTGSTGANTLILDFINGTFAPGYGSGAGTAGISVDLDTGADAFKIRGSTAADTVTVGADGVAINADAIKDVTLAGVEDVVVSLGAGADVFSASGGYGTGAAYASAIVAYGGEGNDILTGGTGADTLNGGAGDDTLRGATDAAADTADDELNGDAGNDTFDAGNSDNGSDTFTGGLGTDVVSYALRSATVTVTIGAGADDGVAGEADTVDATTEGVTGGSGDDSLTGDSGNNTLSGGAGEDTLTGGDGDDVYNGGDNDDTFVAESAADGADTFNGGAGIDVVDFSARSAGITLTIDSVANDGETGAGEGDNVKSDVEDVIGTDYDDVITGSASNNNITGGDGDDVLSGLAGNDVFDEGASPNGGDRFIGGLGTDLVDYSGRSGALDVTMDGAAADDGESSEGDDVEADIEDLWCGAEADTVVGNDLANFIDGGAEADDISGGAGNDTLFGGADVDVLDGGAGDDLVDGGGGTETSLDCGDGDGDIVILGASETASNCEL